MTLLSTTQWRLPAWAVLAIAALGAALVLLAVVTALANRRARRRDRAAADALTARVGELQARLDDLTSTATRAPAASGSREFVITSLGESAAEPTPASREAVSLTAPAFADAVLRESVVHTASFLHGVRRAVSAEARNRIRFEMRRELKRSRKERRVEMKEALREYRARHRAEVPADTPPGVRDGAA